MVIFIVVKVTIYNKTLNPNFWDENKILKPEIRKVLLKIANTFYNDIELKAHIRDIYFLGSSANYNWTTTSDIDLHLLIDFNDLKMLPEIAKKFTKTLTSKWNENQDINIKGHKVEVYIQNITEENRSTGIYSLITNRWIKEATPQNIVLDKNLIQQKYTTWVLKINKALTSKNVENLKKVIQDLVKVRDTALSVGGEFSTENIVFKILRQSGLIKKIKDTIGNIRNNQLSIADNKQLNEVEKINAYHGTSNKFDKFIKQKINPSHILPFGIHFSENINVAKTYGNNIHNVKLNFNKLYDATGNPDEIAIEIAGRRYRKGMTSQECLDAGTGSAPYGMHNAEYILEKYGYDGVKYKDKNGSINYIVFNENQIEYGKQLNEITITDTAYFWMDKNAKLYKVPLFGHKRFAADYLKLDIPDAELGLRGDIYTKMLVLGFIRITVYSGQLQFEYDKKMPPNDSQMKELKDISIENNLWLYDDTRQRTIDIDESLNQKVNAAYDPTSMGANAVNIGVPDKNFYNRNNIKMRRMEEIK